jgi:hypothetical protein
VTLNVVPAVWLIDGFATGMLKAAGLGLLGLQVHVFHGGIDALGTNPDGATGIGRTNEGAIRIPTSIATANPVNPKRR